MEHYVILHNQVPRYVHRDLCYAAMAKYVALHNATYLAIATVFGPKNQELLMDSAIATTIVSAIVAMIVSARVATIVR